MKTDNDVDLEKTIPTAPILAPPTLTSPALSPVPVTGAPASSSSTPAEAGASRVAEPNTKTEHEQRTTESASGQSSQEAPHAAKHHEASEEALKGPQGPAPVPAEDFEREAKGMKPMKSDRGAVQNGSSKSTDKGSHGNGNGKHSPLHKMKEKLSKVVHPSHGSHKA